MNLEEDRIKQEETVRQRQDAGGNDRLRSTPSVASREEEQGAPAGRRRQEARRRAAHARRNGSPAAAIHQAEIEKARLAAEKAPPASSSFATCKSTRLQIKTLTQGQAQEAAHLDRRGRRCLLAHRAHWRWHHHQEPVRPASGGQCSLRKRKGGAAGGAREAELRAPGRAGQHGTKPSLPCGRTPKDDARPRGRSSSGSPRPRTRRLRPSNS